MMAENYAIVEAAPRDAQTTLTKWVTVFFPDGGLDRMELPIRLVGDVFYWDREGCIIPLEALKKRAETSEEYKEALARIAGERMLRGI